VRLTANLVVMGMLALAVLIAMDGRHREPLKDNAIQPRDGGCAVPWTRSRTDGAGNATTLSLCFSQQGNLTSLRYPDTSEGHEHVEFDAYCLDYTPHDGFGETNTADFGGAPGAQSSFGFGPAVIAQPNGPNTNPIVMTRSTTDGKFQVSEYVKVKFAARAITVAVSVKNTSGVAQDFLYERALSPKTDAYAGNDQYNEFGISSNSGFGTTGIAYQNPGPGTNALLFSVASGSFTSRPTVTTDPFADWLSAANGSGSGPRCDGGLDNDFPGYVSGGFRVFVGTALQAAPNGLPNDSVAAITYNIRML
jgi:hypothetical protein